MICALAGLAGCLPLPGQPDAADTQPEQVLAARPGDPPTDAEAPPLAVSGRHVENEPNDDFETAERLTLIGEVELVGSIAAGSAPLDRDLFDIGPVEPGDRIVGTLATDPGVDLVVGLLDDQGRLLGFVDPNSGTSGPHFLDIPVFEASRRLFVSVAARSASPLNRAYTVRIRIDRGQNLPPFRPQVVILEFQGASDVRIGSRPAVNVPPFDAARISPDYVGLTEIMIEQILAFVREHFDGLAVDIYDSRDPGIPSGDRSTVYFGTRDNRLLGLADSIDPFNTNRNQQAILYTDTFAVFNVLSPSPREMAQVLANVTSHEIGHLLGLRHTSSPTDVMDITATARQMLLPQFFETAVLHASVLPLGLQDGPAMLAWTVGGALPSRPAARAVARERAIAVAGGPDDLYIPRSMLGSCSCDGLGDGDE